MFTRHAERCVVCREKREEGVVGPIPSFPCTPNSNHAKGTQIGALSHGALRTDAYARGPGVVHRSQMFYRHRSTSIELSLVMPTRVSRQPTSGGTEGAALFSPAQGQRANAWRQLFSWCLRLSSHTVACYSHVVAVWSRTLVHPNCHRVNSQLALDDTR